MMKKRPEVRGQRTAIARAETLWNQERQNDETFLERVLLYLGHGYVISTPEVFLMMRPVQTSGLLEQIADPEYRFERPDAWFVDVAVAPSRSGGGLRQLPQLMPYPLPFICFWRKFRKNLRRYETPALFRKIALCHP